MANPEHLAKLKEGRDAWNQWRHSLPPIRAREDSPIRFKPNLPEADLSGAVLVEKNLSGMDLTRANLGGTTLTGSDLTMAKLYQADLKKSVLSRVRLNSADLTGADLRDAVVIDSFMSNAKVNSARLNRANLSGAMLKAADLSGADLREASLERAHLIEANLYAAKLDGSIFANAMVGKTTFDHNDLSTVKGLETVHHVGPSVIGIDTIYRSKGTIPESFLRGCGVPEDFITFIKSLTTNPIEFYSCFISYSTKDQDFADRLYADLQNKGVRCWFAPHDIKAGKKLHEQIDEAIRLHDKLLLILSPYSMESEWVKTEIAKARKREVRDQRRVLFPIRLAPFETLRDWECFDADAGKDSAREIREYFIPDFSNWKNHDSYQEAFQRLISDLKASDSKPK